MEGTENTALALDAAPDTDLDAAAEADEDGAADDGAADDGAADEGAAEDLTMERWMGVVSERRACMLDRAEAASGASARREEMT
jgi:hypothetical protein